MRFKLIKDDYFRKKGSEAKLIKVSCSSCKKLIFIYQKDMPRGWLKRCYLNRILYPEKYQELQYKIKKLEDLSTLICECGETIGSPVYHKNQRFAFSLIRGKFKRTDYIEK